MNEVQLKEFLKIPIDKRSKFLSEIEKLVAKKIKSVSG
mgnify:CR=1 FL=1